VGNHVYHVVTSISTDSTAVLDGFIVTAGWAEGSVGRNENGGGMYNKNSSPTVRNVTFSDNTALYYGAGMYNESSNPTLINVTFSGNAVAVFSGGGMYNNSSSPTLTNVTFRDNWADNGGGMYNESSSPTLTNVIFRGNLATNGGGMYNYDSSPMLTNITFSGNTASSTGGGMLNVNFSSPTLTNVIMWGNSAPIWSEIANYDSNPRIVYSDIKGCGGSPSWHLACGTNGGGNIDADPLFGSAAEGNLHLHLTSPAIDAGDNTAVPSGITSDLDGNPRFVDIPSIPDTGRGTPPIVDMGAFEAYKYLYAAPTVHGKDNCLSWENTCELQTALSIALNGQEIWVQAGAHYPGAAGDRLATFTLKKGVALYGGFTGTETSRDQRDWQTNLTILSGDIDNNDTNADGNNIAETPSNIQGSNAYHVVTSISTFSNTVLDGFIITAGQANGADPENLGGGMFNKSSSPTLTNLIFSGNTATNRGGGMYNLENSSPQVTNVTFSCNTSSNAGGGMYNLEESNPTLTGVTFSRNSASAGGGLFNGGSSSPTLTDVSFSGNTATNRGGGMYNLSSSPTLSNVTFSGNTSTKDGGGMFNLENSSPQLSNVTFNGNTATGREGGGMYNGGSSNPTLTDVTFSGNTANFGGGMFNENSSPTLTDVTFRDNTSISPGGGMYNLHSSPTLMDATFSGNTNNSTGGGMYNYGGNPRLTNVTFNGNSAGLGGSGMGNDFSSPALTNVIMWGNIGSEIYNGNSTPSIAYSDIQGCGGSGAGWVTSCGADNGGNIDADPLFVDAAAGNLRLQSTSPAIDAGNNAAVPASVTTDLDGNPRFVDIPSVPDTGSGTPPIVDMGAYEVQTSAIFLPLMYKSTP
jgi:predicted outer membrane repeat protein